MSDVNVSGNGGGQGAPGSSEREADAAERCDPAWFEVALEESRGAAGCFVRVVFNRPIEEALTYRVPARLSRTIQPGQRVRVPLGRGDRLTVGYCVLVERRSPANLEPPHIKEVAEVLDPLPLIDHKMLELTRWMADYYACSWGQALEAVVPAGVKKHAGSRFATFLIVPLETREAVQSGTLRTKLTPKQTAALDVLCRNDELLTPRDVCRLAKCTSIPINALRREGLVHSVRRRLPVGSTGSGARADRAHELVGRPEVPGSQTNDSRPQEGAVTSRPPLVLSADQTEVLARVAPVVQAGGFEPFLIHGVTGSGKTEVYLAAIEMVVTRGREAIVLVPEISLTPQTIHRFRRRFAKVAVLHSHLSDTERHRHWQSIAAGEIEVVVGARSAVFAPTRRLGLIVIDEEHESTFKQETTPRYHARDLAVKRAQMEGIPVLLGSATPSLESWLNAERQRYSRVAMPARVGGRAMPDVGIIDLRNDKPPLGGLSEPLRQAIARALAEGGQVILLLNRRGFHTLVICPRCGHVVKCRTCEVTVTYHKSRHLMICHTCDAERACPPACPACRAPGLHYGGIGTERLECEIRTAFPGVVSRRMDSDTMRSPGSHEQVLAAFKAGEIQILMGTQMIAKGLDFPNVTLVGVVSADTALHLPDFRASERTFQLVAQVAGRTGRGDRPGRVLVQTYAPYHPAIVSASQHDYHAFASAELRERERFGVPPFVRLVRLIARGPQEEEVHSYLKELAAAFREQAAPAVRVLGPAPAPILKIRNLYRFHLQLRCPNSRPLQILLDTVPAQHLPPRRVELVIDVDPMTML
jgi:primosomal protein N' (replication factor Y)